MMALAFTDRVVVVVSTSMLYLYLFHSRSCAALLPLLASSSLPGRNVLAVVERAEEGQQRDHVPEEELGEELGVGGVAPAVGRLSPLCEPVALAGTRASRACTRLARNCAIWNWVR